MVCVNLCQPTPLRYLLAVCGVGLGVFSNAASTFAQPPQSAVQQSQTAEAAAEAKQLVNIGKHSEACDVYLKVLRRDPSIFSRDFYDVERPFLQSGRLAELVDLIIELGPPKFEPYRVAELCERLVTSHRNIEKAQQLFDAIIHQRTSPQNIMLALNNMSSSFRSLINDEAILIEVTDAIIKVSTASSGNVWSSAFSNYSTGSDGRTNNALTILVQLSSSKPERVQALEKRLRDELERKQDWLEGKIWLGLLMAATKRYDEAKSLLAPLTGQTRPGSSALWLIGSVIDSHRPLNSLTEQLYETAMKESARSPGDFEYGEFEYTLPSRVCKYWIEQGDKPRAKAILMSELDRLNQIRDRSAPPPRDYEAFQKITNAISLMRLLLQVDAPIEAMKIARKFDRSNFAKASRYDNNAQAKFDERVQEVEVALSRLGGLTLLESMIDAETKGPYAVDLGMLLDNQPFTGAGMKSLWQAQSAKIALNPELAPAAQQLIERLKKLQEVRPRDRSLEFAVAILGSYVGSPELLAELWRTEKSVPTSVDALKDLDEKDLAQWLALAYVRSVELDASQPAALDPAKIEHWLAEHTQTWPLELRCALLAQLGKLALAKKDNVAADKIWSHCLDQPDVTRWMLIDLAIASMNANLTELSLRSATAAGKAADGLPHSQAARRQVGGSTRGATEDEAESSLAIQLLSLDNAWTKHNVEPQRLLAPLSALVRLEEEDSETWPRKYLRTNNNQWDLDSLFDRLARRAHACGQTEWLLKKIIHGDSAAVTPDQLAQKAPDRAILAALAWLRDDRGDNAVDYLKALDATRLNTVHRTIALQVLTAGLRNRTCRRAAVDLGLAWAAANKPTDRYAPASPFDQLTFDILRTAIENGMDEKLQSSAAAVYLDLCRHENDKYSGNTRFSRSISQLEEIAKLYLDRGQNVYALKFLGQRQADYAQGFDRDDDWLGNWVLSNIQSKSNRLQAYQLLINWTFQGDAGLTYIANFARRARLPNWIPEEVGGRYPQFAPIADQRIPLVSSYYTLALLAEEVKQSEQLIAHYEEARNQKRVGATVGLAITLSALKRPIPAELFAEITSHLESIRPKADMNSAKTSAPLPELHLAILCRRHTEYAPWARETIAEIEKHASPLGRFFLAPWLSSYKYQVGWSEWQSMKTSEGLKHWTASTAGTAKDFYEGKTSPLWLVSDQGEIVHLCGFAADWLWWRYPLEGNFEFSFETEESSGREIEFYASGLRFISSSQYVDILSDDYRDWVRIERTAKQKGEWNQHTLSVDDKSLKYSVNGTIIYQEPRSSEPIAFAMRATGYKQATCRGVKLTGQPKISRTVPLLSDDRLRGWAGTFYSQTLPSNKIALEAGQTDNRMIRTGLTPGEKSKLNWTIENRELVSGQATSTAPGKQSVIQYSRPMTDGDKLEYEFFYEPGQYEVHPALGRTVYFLRPEGVHRHWMTEPYTSWKTPSDNRFLIEGARPLQLKAGQWNKVHIDFGAGRLTLSVNGQPAIELPWKGDLSDGTFGLFHFTDQSQVRVRNVNLTGTWPEEMPTNMFAR